MSLFEECKEALKNDFQIIEDSKEVIAKLNIYPIHLNSIIWTNMDFREFDDMDELLKYVQEFQDTVVYVVADDKDIPIFTSTLNAVIENIYDVMALSPKVFIFNNEVILEPLFPSYNIRVALNH
ncbi:hypothetical protein [Acinetobacter sp.]|uniref:CDI toxin immunity protein n=1 Tax=Acinetobacter sp. TaxID=472 RepID=UPI0028AE1434|nr:hypothetical protein [Acinetobacter sp.]